MKRRKGGGGHFEKVINGSATCEIHYNKMEKKVAKLRHYRDQVEVSARAVREIVRDVFKSPAPA